MIIGRSYVKFLIVVGFLSTFFGYLITPLSLILIYGSKLDMALVNLVIAVALILLGKELVRVAFKRLEPED